MTKIEEKKLHLKNFLLSEIAIFLSLVIHKGRLHEKTSALKREYPALQNINSLHFFFMGNFCTPGSGSSRKN
jgi:hypothetical protein